MCRLDRFKYKWLRIDSLIGEGFRLGITWDYITINLSSDSYYRKSATKIHIWDKLDHFKYVNEYHYSWTHFDNDSL